MRSYLVCSLGVALLVAVGCGDDRVTTDARDGSGDTKSDGNESVDRPDSSGTGGSTGGTGGSTGGTGGSTGGTGGSTGGVSGSGGTGGVAGSGGTGGTGGGVDGGSDGGAPTCSDGIMNSDETGIDCGGHCGKCGPGNPCLVNADCTYACKADKTCAACNVAADCAGNESECEHRTCTVGVCGSMREAAGTVLTVQNTGDCKRRQCAADGTVANANDDTDVPEDRNPCTNDICTSGAPSHTMMPANSNCGGANHCNANGQCVGCAVAADCPGTDTACRIRTCSAAGVCGFNFTAANTKLVDPTTGDCKGLQCDGAGNSQVFNDDPDLPVDGNICTTDECSSGTPSHRPVQSGTNCGGSKMCDGANNCVDCLSASTCPGTDTDCRTRSCMSGTCGITNIATGTLAAAQTPADCKKNVCNGEGTSGPVSDDLDLPVDGNPCTHDVCTTGTPSNPFVTAGNSCGGSTICDGQGACVTCLTASSCPGTDTDCRMRTCTNGACGVDFAPAGTALTLQMTGDCKKAQCDGAGQSMVVNDNADVPADGNACTDDICTAGVPSNPNLSSGTTCGTNQVCTGQGACVGCITAANCGTDTACRTFACTNNQCVVTNVAAGTALATQTAGDCKKVQCDGSGQSQTVNDDTDKPVDTNACTQDVCAAGIPSNPPESAGTACSQNGGSKCNGSGSAPACVQCLAIADCSGTDTECRVRTCTAGVCGTSNTADGTAVSSQTPRDCKKNICMTGNQVTVNDVTDVPVDNNGCTMDVCTGGTPSNPSLPPNATCNENGGTRCNGAATAPACVQCLTAGQCGTDSVCQTFTCSGAGVCITNNVPNGTAIAAQTAGDCLTNVCNGNGQQTTAVNNLDVPVDNITCTQDVCVAGTPQHPPVSAGTACSQSGGIKCDGNGACVACLASTDCGTTTFCKTFNCSAAGTCSSTNTTNGTPLPGQTGADCKKNVCMTGAATVVNDDADVIVDGNLCTDDLCSNGTPSNPPRPISTPCGTNQMCNATGMCVGCLMDSDCPTPANECQIRVCNSGTCGVTFVTQGMLLSAQTPGDCKQSVCDGAGNIDVSIDNNDKPPTSNMCLESVCTAGVPSNPPATQGTACTGPNNATLCNGSGACVECLHPSTCPGGPDSQCHQVTCDAGVCGIAFTAAGTTIQSPQPSGDCRRNQCDGAGNIESVADDTDDPAPTTVCATPVCLGGTPLPGNVAHGTMCSEGDGRTCDGAGACITSFSVIRWSGNAGTAVAATIEERKLDGTVVGTPIGLPTLVTTAGNRALTVTGSSSSEGSLSLSGNGQYLICNGYNATVGTATAGADRVIGRVDAAGNVNTTTAIAATAIYTGDNFRGATSNDGTGFWASGNNGAGSTNGGLWWVPLGGTGAMQLSTTTTNTRVVHVFGGQLYATSNQTNLSNVFSVGSGLPMAPPAALTATPGMPASNQSPFSFIFLERNASVDGPDLLYVADDGAGTGGTTNRGIQKWTRATTGASWVKVANHFNLATATGFRGVTAVPTGANITIVATTAGTSANSIVKWVDDGSVPPVTGNGMVIFTAPANQSVRGVALSPVLGP